MENLAVRSILQMGNGRILEKVDYELPRLMQNLFDPNTKATAKRKMVITLEFSADEERENITVDTTVKLSLVPPHATRISLHAASQDHIYDMTPQVPGQVDFGGETQPEPAMMRLINL